MSITEDRTSKTPTDPNGRPLTEAEVRLLELLRPQIESVIKTRGAAWAADQLDIGETGVEAILWRSTWTVEATIHLAATLGILTVASVNGLSAALSHR